MQKTSGSAARRMQESPGKSMFTVKGEENDDSLGLEDGDEQVDPDALAYIKAKRKVNDLHKAKRLEKKGVHWWSINLSIIELNVSM